MATPTLSKPPIDEKVLAQSPELASWLLLLWNYVKALEARIAALEP
jgi:hypothetical protein